MGEFIDNAIQACSANIAERQISVSLHLFTGGINFITVMDNGHGMDTIGLQTFATYSFDQETRQIRPKHGDKSFISKFGVGVKQAGFFLGDRIRVLTKVKHDDSVREFTLSKEDFKQKYEGHANVYAGTVTSRAKGSMQNVPADEAKVGKMINAIKAHESQFDQFTIFVIRVNDDVSRRLGVRDHGRYERIPAELAEIYHFHLHPEHKPDRLAIGAPGNPAK